MKAANPNLPILIREAKGAEAKIFARFGKRRSIYLDPILRHHGAGLLHQTGLYGRFALLKAFMGTMVAMLTLRIRKT